MHGEGLALWLDRYGCVGARGLLTPLRQASQAPPGLIWHEPGKAREVKRRLVEHNLIFCLSSVPLLQNSESLRAFCRLSAQQNGEPNTGKEKSGLDKGVLIKLSFFFFFRKSALIYFSLSADRNAIIWLLLSDKGSGMNPNINHNNAWGILRHRLLAAWYGCYFSFSPSSTLTICNLGRVSSRYALLSVMQPGRNSSCRFLPRLAIVAAWKDGCYPGLFHCFGR